MGFLGVVVDTEYFTGVPTETVVQDEFFESVEFEDDDYYHDSGRFVRLYPERILGNVVISPNGCWDWIGYRDTRGKCKLSVDGYLYTAQRYSYLCQFGYIPDGYRVVKNYECSEGCCNPFHLRCVPKGNSRDVVYNPDGEFTYYIPRINPSTGKLLQCENGRRLTIQEKYTYIVGLNNAARYTGLDKRVIKRHTDPITRIFNHYSYMDACKDNGYREIIPTLCGIALQY